ncbi:hypothetical protein [Methylococcus sp. EFPC2]|uniref:hypothetical protein n=1 Tax=Methylococcus sp. EFPC2 TaxID=2812648 RepID=UPI001967F74A|nr:hypothetical protein [Methylococcus sp. EFPC2]QSA99206.1 hypothetical protein JWZ97_14875 [Methylococcus sp. EFPC2]
MIFNYFALFLVSVVGIVFLDDDITSVSIQEWILFAVMIYAVLGIFRHYRDLLNQERRRR